MFICLFIVYFITLSAAEACQGNRSAGQHLNLGSPEHKAGQLTTRPLRSVSIMQGVDDLVRRLTAWLDLLGK